MFLYFIVHNSLCPIDLQMYSQWLDAKSELSKIFAVVFKMVLKFSAKSKDLQVGRYILFQNHMFVSRQSKKKRMKYN